MYVNLTTFPRHAKISKEKKNKSWKREMSPSLKKYIKKY